jgi:hypothetical protein
MKKLILLIGGVIGFFAGSRSGREPYERLEVAVRKVTGTAEVQHAKASLTEAAQDVRDATVSAASDAVDDVTKTVKQKVSTAS